MRDHFLLPSNDICSDDIRGYEKDASSSLDLVRKSLSAVNAKAGSKEIYKAPKLDGLNPANFAVLRACDAQCKILRQCLRFVFWKPPSQACPVEYEDYKKTARSAADVLAKINELRVEATRAEQKADEVGHARKDVEELEKSSGSTGGRIAVLRARLLQLESELTQNVQGINQGLTTLASPQEIAK